MILKKYLFVNEKLLHKFKQKNTSLFMMPNKILLKVKVSYGVSTHCNVQ